MWRSILFAVIMRKSKSSKTFARALAFEETFPCEVEATKLIKHISNGIPKSSKIPDYTREAHVLRHVK